MNEKMIATARDTALEVLMQISSANAWSDGSLKRTISRNGLDSRDAAFATRLAYGVVQNRILLDYYIGHYCSQRPGHLETVVLNVLRIGAYQILFMDKVPAHSAVNEAVEMVKRHGRPKAAGLVNAVLRKLAASRQSLPALPADSEASWLSVQYSHPQWLVQRILDTIGPEETERFLRGNNEIIPISIQTNRLKVTPDQLEKELLEAEVQLERHPWLEGCFLVSGAGDMESLPAFREGHFMVQDAAARLAVLAAQAEPGDRVMDVCAAPGGKSFSMAIDMADEGDILSCDIHPHKLKLLENGAARLGIRSVRTALADGREPHAAWREQADLVVADVPCSGLGIIRKKPDIRYKDPKELAGLPDVQRAILANAASYVRPGGALLYSTCTVLRAENEAVTDEFLAQHPDFVREPFELPGPIGRVDGQVTLWPQRQGTDGFYICRMRRKD
jgi:16S rRNA (cytosine967-C5)-methyltransferase